MTALLFLAFLGLLVLGVPIGFAIAAAAIAVLLVGDANLLIVVQRMFASTDSFSLVAVPFFILAGDLLARGSMSQTLVAFAESLLGRIRGGLSAVAVAAGMFFAAISGSGVTTEESRTNRSHTSFTVGYSPAAVMASIAPPIPGPCSDSRHCSSTFRILAIIRFHRALLVPPPQILELLIWIPSERATSTESRIANATPSRTACTRSALVVSMVIPMKVPRALVSLMGLRSPIR